MTVKEIAVAIGKDERTVARWVESLSDKMSEVSDKVSEAKQTKRPADYTLPEVIEIIRQGMGDGPAGVFADNANKQKRQRPPKR